MNGFESPHKCIQRFVTKLQGDEEFIKCSYSAAASKELCGKALPA